MLDHVLDSVRGAHVDSQWLGRSTGATDSFSIGLSRLCRDIGDEHTSPILRQAARRRSADAHSTTCHDRNLICECWQRNTPVGRSPGDCRGEVPYRREVLVSAGYVVRRVLMFFVVVWAATTFIFFLPKLAPGRNPVMERIGMMVATGGVNTGGLQEMVEAYQKKFGLDKPLLEQYLTYLGDISHLDFGYSLMLYPTKVVDVILTALPWTIGLLT